jgi:iron complex outermembrane receptor protein
MIRYICLVAIFTSFRLYAQDADSIRTHVLSEVVVQGVQIEKDTLETFYKTNPAATTEGILSRMHCVSLTRRGSFGQEPMIRGMSNGQVNVTIDGMKMFGACTDKMDPISIYVEPINLTAIQAKTGVQASEFGSTFGGSLNMRLAEPIVGQHARWQKAGLDLQSASRATNFYSTFNHGANKSGYLGSVTFRKSNNYAAGGGQEVLYSQYTKLNVSTSGKWSLGNADTLRADVLFDQGWNIGFPALPMDVGSATAGVGSVTYQKYLPWWRINTIKLKAYHNVVRHIMDDTRRPNVAMHMDMPGKSRTTGAYAEADVHVFCDQQTIAKLEYFANTTLGEMTMYSEEGTPMYMQTAPRATRSDLAFYVSQKIKVNRANRMYLTIRGDFVNDYLHNGIGRNQVEIIAGRNFVSSSSFIGSYGVSYTRNLSSNTKMQIEGGYGQRMPTLNERFGFYLFNRMDNYDYIGNASLKPESSFTAEGTLNHYGESFEIQLTPFFKKIDNFIMGEVVSDTRPMTIGAKGIKQFANVGSAYLRGLEAMVLAAPVEYMQWITTLKYARGTTSSGEAMPQILPLKVVSSIRVNKARINSQLECEWAAEQNHVSKSFGEVKTPSYFLMNLRFGYSLNDHWTFNSGLENVFDKEYREHLDWGGILRPGRNIYLSASLKF